ncbi:MAG: hypothetical protein AAGD23_04595 [Pseudomonadota bacterium]
MTDFYSVLRKAVDGLADNNAAGRKALYARAEAALVAQLTNAEGETPEAQIEEVRTSLQQAAQRIEGEEAVKEAVATPEPPATPPVTTSTTTQPYVSPLRQRLGGAGTAGAATTGTELPPATPPQAPFAVPQSTPPPAPTAASATPSEPPPGIQPPVTTSAVLDAPAQPVQQPAPPAVTTSPAAPAGIVPPAAVAPPPAPAAPAPPAPPPPAAAAPPPPPPPAPPPGSEPAVQDIQSAAPGFAPELQNQQPAPDPNDWPEGTAYVAEPPRRRWGLAITLVALAGLGAVGYWQREVVLQTVEPIIAIVNPGGQDADKVEERLPGAEEETPEPAPAPAPAAPEQATAEPAAPPPPAVIEALLIEESGQEGVAPTQVAGSVNWALRQQDGSAYIEGQVQIPERQLSLTINIFRNQDPEFPATHTIDFFFQTPANVTTERIENVPGLLVKQTPRAAGGPLAGEVVKVDDGVFLMALHSRNPDAESNRIRLKEQPFFDVPVVYASGKRAIITLAKGTEGQSVFDQAFETWGQ